MLEDPLKQIRLAPDPFRCLGPALRVTSFWAAVLTLVAAIALSIDPATRTLAWPGALALLTGTLAVITGMTRQLPAQNVLGGAILAGAIGSAAQAMGTLTGVPFGPYVYTQDIGRLLFGALPWITPFVWIVFLLASRGVARLILRPWRRAANYGFKVLGLTACLVVLLDLGLEVYCTRVFGYWNWSGTKLHLDLLGVPVVNFLGWGLVSVLAMVFLTPLFIVKKPGPPPPADFQPLVLWWLIVWLFAAGAFSSGLKGAALCLGLTAVVVGGLAAAGGRAKG